MGPVLEILGITLPLSLGIAAAPWAIISLTFIDSQGSFQCLCLYDGLVYRLDSGGHRCVEQPGISNRFRRTFAIDGLDSSWNGDGISYYQPFFH